MFSKENQLAETKKPTPKKMTKIEKRLYVDFIRDKCGRKCQISWCDKEAQDFAHKDRAYKRDDRHGGLLCRHHHTTADNPSPRQIEQSITIKIAGKNMAKRNWRDYTS